MEATVLPDRLSDDQLQHFDRDMMIGDRWPTVCRSIEADFPSGEFSFLDVGGGNGLFADRVIATYPKATGTVLDSSALLLSKNRTHPQKRTVQADATDLRETGKHDVIFFNWMLHHLVKTSDYETTRENIRRTLRSARESLTERGRVSIFDFDYDGLIEGAPGWLIFTLSSSALLAPITNRLGANTAGVGVCYLSSRQWREEIEAAGMTLRSASPQPRRRVPAYQRLLLIRSIGSTHYWASA